MPLQPGSSPEVIAANIKELVAAGHSQAQAVAIAEKNADEHRADDGFDDTGLTPHPEPSAGPPLTSGADQVSQPASAVSTDALDPGEALYAVDPGDEEEEETPLVNGFVPEEVSVWIVDGGEVRPFIREDGPPGQFTTTRSVQQGPERLFLYVPLPAELRGRLTALGQMVAIAASPLAPIDVDHVSLVVCPKMPEGYPADVVDRVRLVCAGVCAAAEPIAARIQGWAYFDGAAKDGQPCTALVALVDAPGLDHLHVELVKTLTACGIEPFNTHIYTAHATVAFLPVGARVPDLPMLNESFAIDQIAFVNIDTIALPLGQGVPRYDQTQLDAQVDGVS